LFFVAAVVFCCCFLFVFVFCFLLSSPIKTTFLKLKNNLSMSGPLIYCSYFIVRKHSVFWHTFSLGIYNYKVLPIRS
jgi:hypothetical protein